MRSKSRMKMKKFVQEQKTQLGLDDAETETLLDRVFQDADEADEFEDEAEVFDLAIDSEGYEPKLALESDNGRELRTSAPSPWPQAASSKEKSRPGRKKVRRKAMSDPYLSESQTIRTRPSKVSKIRSLLFEHAMPNEYIMQIGVKTPKAMLGGKFFKIGKRFLKFPATVQTVYFTSDNANMNYQGLRIDGYACWRIDPENPEIAARTLDFSDQENPMGNTNRILRTICTEAIRHIISNISIDDALTKKDEIGRDLKSQLERIERSWGITFDQVGIERVTILSSKVFDDLQQKTRDALRLEASESRMETDQKIEKKKAGYKEEAEALRRDAEKKSRILNAASESEIHKAELDERVKREAETRKALEARRKAENEASERASEQETERLKRQTARDAEIEAQKESEQHKLKMARITSVAEIRTSEAETRAKVAEAQAQSEIAIYNAEHKKQLKKQELEAAQNLQIMENEQGLESARLAGELQMAGDRFAQTKKERREQAEMELEIATKHLDILKSEEEVRNLISENRIVAELVNKLPEIASCLKIDRYTVLDTSGNSPLAYSLAQILSVLEENGLGRFFDDDQ